MKRSQIMGTRPYPVHFSASFWNPSFVILLMTIAMRFLLDILSKSRTKSI